METIELLNRCHGLNGEKIRRTKSDKVHIPGEPENGIQRCIRCRARIDSGRTWNPLGFATSFWKVGRPILMRRSGSTILTEAQAASLPACGRRSCHHEICDANCGQRGCVGFHRIHGPAERLGSAS